MDMPKAILREYYGKKNNLDIARSNTHMMHFEAPIKYNILQKERNRIRF
jgi:hypothetical protein